MSQQPTDELSGAQRRLIQRLKRLDGATAADLATDFELTPTAVRQHLESLSRAGLVEPEPAEGSGARGRPARRWQLTALASSLFPDHHADLTVSLIEATRTTLGDAALDAVVNARTEAQLAAYREVLPDPATAPVGERVADLARLRTAEGYMAEAVAGDDDSYLLVEHHCPICEAATACQGLCRGELELFRAALGSDVTIRRSQHLMAGDRRCVYQIARRS